MYPCLTDFISGNSYELQPLVSLGQPVSAGTGHRPIWSGSPGPSPAPATMIQLNVRSKLTSSLMAQMAKNLPTMQETWI